MRTIPRTEGGECELDEIMLGQFRFTLLWRVFNEDQLSQIRRLWLDAEEAAEKHARELRSQP